MFLQFQICLIHKELIQNIFIDRVLSNLNNNVCIPIIINNPVFQIKNILFRFIQTCMSKIENSLFLNKNLFLIIFF